MAPRPRSITDTIKRRARTVMKWKSRSVRSRADISFFIFIIFFAVFSVTVLTNLLFLESPPPVTRTRYNEELQGWEGKTEEDGPVAEPPPPAQAPRDAVWQPVSGTKFKFYVYSAYVERRTFAAIRIIAATKTGSPDPVFCRLWLPNNRTLTLKARVQSIRENWNLRYSATYVLCFLRETRVRPQDTVGAAVAVLANAAPQRPPTNLLPVLSTTPAQGIEDKVHVCVKPFHFTYSKNDWLLEWFELQRLLGISHFYMYNSSLSDRTSCILNYYKEKGLVTLLPWKLPLVSKVEIRTEGLFAAFNDCLYRSMTSAGWLLVIDVDEAVLPRRERTIPAMLSALTASYTPPAKIPAAFLFRNAFFYEQWDDDPEATSSLLTARKTRRWATPHVLKNRSKYAVRPYEVLELGNHFLWEHAPGGTSVGVHVDRALLHHYRANCEFGGYECLKLPSTVDRTAHRWTDELVQNVKALKQVFEKTCPT